MYFTEEFENKINKMNDKEKEIYREELMQKDPSIRTEDETAFVLEAFSDDDWDVADDDNENDENEGKNGREEDVVVQQSQNDENIDDIMKKYLEKHGYEDNGYDENEYSTTEYDEELENQEKKLKERKKIQGEYGDIPLTFDINNQTYDIEDEIIDDKLEGHSHAFIKLPYKLLQSGMDIKKITILSFIIYKWQKEYKRPKLKGKHFNSFVPVYNDEMMRIIACIKSETSLTKYILELEKAGYFKTVNKGKYKGYKINKELCEKYFSF